MAHRFQNVKPGDALVSWCQNWTTKEWRCEHWIVTDRWFDPVRGQDKRMKGEMVAIRMLRHGRLGGMKSAHTVRGLAWNGFHYADSDPGPPVTKRAAKDFEEQSARKATHEGGPTMQ